MAQARSVVVPRAGFFILALRLRHQHQKPPAQHQELLVNTRTPKSKGRVLASSSGARRQQALLVALTHRAHVVEDETCQLFCFLPQFTSADSEAVFPIYKQTLASLASERGFHFQSFLLQNPHFAGQNSEGVESELWDFRHKSGIRPCSVEPNPGIRAFGANPGVELWSSSISGVELIRSGVGPRIADVLGRSSDGAENTVTQTMMEEMQLRWWGAAEVLGRLWAG